MAIDTANKRKSVLGLVGHFMLPIPDGSIDSVNRRQLSDFYALLPFVRVRSFWVQDKDSSQSWVQNRPSSNSWIQDQDSSNNWKKGANVTE